MSNYGNDREDMKDTLCAELYQKTDGKSQEWLNELRSHLTERELEIFNQALKDRPTKH